MWGNRENFPARGYFTPQPPKRAARPPVSPVTMTVPMSERKRSSPDLFHIVHKVPPGDSPYVKAKRVQLIDKDPSKAISLFWAAINAGDRVDSALKDMAIIMKQLNRSDEAIEAIKSFRHLCPFDSQESLDNVLIELYKRSGRIEEEIEMLQHKLRLIEEGKGFSASRTKTARSQGKKIQVTREQERSRILGNLAWAHLQLSNYEITEGLYREALSLEPDKNKQCNLAICLMHMNKIAEAKAVLDAVRGSCCIRDMDDSYAKSFDRALQMLNEIELPSIRQNEGHHKESNNSRESTCITERVINRGPQSLASTTIANGHGEDTWILNERNGVLSRGKARSPSETIFCDNWREVPHFGTPLRYVSLGNLHAKENCFEANKAGRSSSSKSVYASPAFVKRTIEFSTGESRRHTCRSLHASPASFRETESKSKATSTGETKISGNCSAAIAEPKNYDDNMIHSIATNASSKGDPAKLVKTSTNDIKDSSGKSFWVDKHKKSWADMAEEEEQDLTDPPVHLWDNSPQKPSPFRTPTKSSRIADHEDEEGFNDENLDINIAGHSSSHEQWTLTENLSRTLTFSNLECGSKSQTVDISSGTSGRSAVRRSLNFSQIQKQELDSVILLESKKADDGSLQGNNRVSDAVPAKRVGQPRRKRLQVFQDITRLPPHTT
ncbi:protein POLLENLESS 3-LIKE 1-like [Rhodamnia argentea]|uniref:Protein POLLENLESS 3-LIKE 1-like n=1 Tax=Rhodamnia argentea TaxID=178133 RepID=A0A8B8MUM3_9MYRT|nr:protein POLLENLESS 3-LIKE 1-like [Rhodamnia argentea]